MIAPWLNPSREVELVSQRIGLSAAELGVKRFERSNGLETAIQETTFTFTIVPMMHST